MRVLQIVLLGLSLAVLSACARPEEPVFKTLDNVKFAGADLESSTILLTADAIFHNPNSIGLDVTGLELAVLLDGQQAATVTQGATASVGAQADFTLPLQVALPLKVVTEALQDEGGSLLGGLLTGKKLDVNVDGWVRVKLGGVELKTPIHHQEQVKIKL
jgi:LEA14-like dessication related protein